MNNNEIVRITVVYFKAYKDNIETFKGACIGNEIGFKVKKGDRFKLNIVQCEILDKLNLIDSDKIVVELNFGEFVNFEYDDINQISINLYGEINTMIINRGFVDEISFVLTRGKDIIKEFNKKINRKEVWLG